MEQPIREFINRKLVAKDQEKLQRFLNWAKGKRIFHTKAGVAVVEWVVSKFITIRSKKWVK